MDSPLAIGGRVALVTGASSGIGRQVALDLVAAGAKVIGCARSQAALEETLAATRRFGADSAVRVCDVGDPGQVEELVRGIAADFGGIDILVNNAGFGIYRSLLEAPVGAVESVMRTNFYGAVYCTKAVLPLMVARRSGYIVNIASISGKIGTPNAAAYSASKFAMIGLSESLYHELKPLGIRVSVVCPGPVRTNFRASFDDLAPKAPRLLEIEAKEVSRAVMRCLRRGTFEAVVPRSMALLCLVKSLAPGFVRALMPLALRPRSRASDR